MTISVVPFVTWKHDPYSSTNKAHHTACGRLLQVINDGDTAYCPQCKIVDEQAHHAFHLGMDWIREECVGILTDLSFTEFGQAQETGTVPPVVPHMRGWEMSGTVANDVAEELRLFVLLLTNGNYVVDTTAYPSCDEVSNFKGCYYYVLSNQDGTYTCPEHGQVELDLGDLDEQSEKEDS